MADYISKWHKELGIFSKIKPLIILEGNVLDSFPDQGFGNSALVGMIAA